jgi:hypothetical protein
MFNRKSYIFQNFYNYINIMTISQFTKDILDKIIIELSNHENMTKIENQVIEPLLLYTLKRLSPYLLISSVVFILTFLLALLILLLLIRQIKTPI